MLVGGGGAHPQKNEKAIQLYHKAFKTSNVLLKDQERMQQTQQQHKRGCLCPHTASQRADIRSLRAFLYSELSHPQVPRHMDTALASWKSGRSYSKLTIPLPPSPIPPLQARLASPNQKSYYSFVCCVHFSNPLSQDPNAMSSS